MTHLFYTILLVIKDLYQGLVKFGLVNHPSHLYISLYTACIRFRNAFSSMMPKVSDALWHLRYNSIGLLTIQQHIGNSMNTELWYYA